MNIEQEAYQERQNQMRNEDLEARLYNQYDRDY